MATLTMKHSVVFCLIALGLTVHAQLDSCPRHILCDLERCLTETDNSQTCCRCQSWQPNGHCSENGWIRTSGTGVCNLMVVPQAPPAEGECTPGVSCTRLKCEDRNDVATCCDCTKWNEDGSCKADGWVPRTEGRSCDFQIALGSTSSTTPDKEGEALPPKEVDDVVVELDNMPGFTKESTLPSSEEPVVAEETMSVTVTAEPPIPVGLSLTAPPPIGDGLAPIVEEHV